jgi:TRAP transporter TAXI family solute receptor
MPLPVSPSGKKPAAPRSGKGSTSVMALATALSLLTAVVGASYWISQPTTLRIAVGPPASDDQKLILAMAQSFSLKESRIRLAPITTDGTVESIVLLGAGKTDLAVARGDLEIPADAQSVAILRRNFVALWSPSGPAAIGFKGEPARIREIAGLAGHRVGVVGLGQANTILLRVILAESGVNPQKVSITQFGTDAIAEMTHDATIDAFMMVGPLDSKQISDAVAATARLRGEPRFLPIDVSDAIAERHPLYESEEIPGSAFGSSPARPEDKIETVAINHLIVAPAALSDDTVAAFTRQLFAVRQSLARELPGAGKIQKPDTDKDAALPAHPGAAAYIDGNERTFLDKYSDYIWAAIFALSGLGSAFAWLRHFLKRSEREQNALHRERLLAKISQVHATASLEQLAAMQREVADILRETIDCHNDGAIEDGDLSAFGLVLVQFHQTAAERRAILNAAPPEAVARPKLQA